MANSAHKCFNASDRSYFSLMKKEIHAIAVEHGFDEVRTGEIDIIVAEMASNLVKYGGGGEILVKMTDECDEQALELICIDNGPGMADANKMIGDGMSTGNTMGHGLGSISRLSDVFQVYSQRDWGTILLARVFKKTTRKKNQKSPGSHEIRTLLVSKPGEQVCGDGAAIKCSDDYIQLFLGDGLGHGQDAHAAVETAKRAFDAFEYADPVEAIRHISASVKRTRGLVAAVAVYKMKEKKWSICGVGNILTRVNGMTLSKSYVAYNGIVGLNVPNTMKAQELESEGGQVIIMCSDGIRTKWDLLRYPGILKYDLSILAAAIYKDQARRTDDMSVLVCRLNRNI